MVQEAEKYKAEDEKQRDKVSSKNSLESYAFNMKAAVEDENFKARSMMRTSRRSSTSAMKSSTGLIRIRFVIKLFELGGYRALVNVQVCFYECIGSRG